MGLFGNLFGSKPELPALDPSSPEARRIAAHGPTLEAFVRRIDDKLELVPAEDAVYVFVGKPPGTFGLAWISAGEEHNLKRLVQERKLPASAVTELTERLRSGYEATMPLPRYRLELAGRTVTVNPADRLAAEIGRAIREVA